MSPVHEHKLVNTHLRMYSLITNLWFVIFKICLSQFYTFSNRYIPCTHIIYVRIFTIACTNNNNKSVFVRILRLTFTGSHAFINIYTLLCNESRNSQIRRRLRRHRQSMQTNLYENLYYKVCYI